MKVVELLEVRRENWRELEQLCTSVETKKRRKLGAIAVMRFATLYRSACADLALADSYQLPPATVSYLHQLVGRAHNQLYRARRFDIQSWGREMFYNVPRRLYHDNCLRLAFVIFWGIFIGSMILARTTPEFATALLSKETMEGMQRDFSQPPTGADSQMSAFGVGFYIWHNTGIGLQCFAFGLIFGVGGLFATVFNAAYLGAMFGYMTTVPEKINFFQFVTAHGPFELTAIVLSAGAGMRLGLAMINTRGMSRAESLRLAGRETMPTIGAAMFLFAAAGLIEAFLSPSGAPYIIKALVAAASSAALMFYFVVLGQPAREISAPQPSDIAGELHAT